LEAVGQTISSIRSFTGAAARTATGAVQEGAEGLTQQVTGAATGAAEQLTDAAGAVTQTLSTALGSTGEAAGIGSRIVAGVGATLPEDLLEDAAAGLTTDGIGAGVGILLTLGTVLANVFMGHSSSIPTPPPETLSQPVFTAGLSGT
jgi:hypothetical protein